MLKSIPTSSNTAAPAQTSSPDIVLSIRGLSKSYQSRAGDRLVLDGIDLDVVRGEQDDPASLHVRAASADGRRRHGSWGSD
jgi:hypothetical protein